MRLLKTEKVLDIVIIGTRKPNKNIGKPEINSSIRLRANDRGKSRNIGSSFTTTPPDPQSTVDRVMDQLIHSTSSCGCGSGGVAVKAELFV